MAMPSTVEQSKHYRDEKRFKADRQTMERAGWRISAVIPRPPRKRGLRSLLRRSPKPELDVLYTRRQWHGAGRGVH